jgi:hypothetical protein
MLDPSVVEKKQKHSFPDVTPDLKFDIAIAATIARHPRLGEYLGKVCKTCWSASGDVEVL